MPIDQNYDLVLKDLESRRLRCADELKMLDQLISNLRSFVMGSATVSPRSGAASSQSPLDTRPDLSVASGHAPTNRCYAGMSVRWAILNLLCEHASGSLGTAEIAAALRGGGITSSAQNFTSNVSAVLSGMVNQRREIEQADNGFRITEQGRAVWDGIKHTPQWLNRKDATAA
jgi:hypothetical protein